VLRPVSVPLFVNGMKISQSVVAIEDSRECKATSLELRAKPTRKRLTPGALRAVQRERKQHAGEVARIKRSAR
jgi:hypothetical protein